MAIIILRLFTIIGFLNASAPIKCLHTGLNVYTVRSFYCIEWPCSHQNDEWLIFISDVSTKTIWMITRAPMIFSHLICFLLFPRCDRWVWWHSNKKQRRSSLQLLNPLQHACVSERLVLLTTGIRARCFTEWVMSVLKYCFHFNYTKVF